MSGCKTEKVVRNLEFLFYCVVVVSYRFFLSLLFRFTTYPQDFQATSGLITSKLSGSEVNTTGGGQEDDADVGDNDGDDKQGTPPVIRERQQQEAKEEDFICEEK
jgi:hypothetical protein